MNAQVHQVTPPPSPPPQNQGGAVASRPGRRASDQVQDLPAQYKTEIAQFMATHIVQLMQTSLQLAYHQGRQDALAEAREFVENLVPKGPALAPSNPAQRDQTPVPAPAQRDDNRPGTTPCIHDPAAEHPFCDICAVKRIKEVR